MKLFLGVLLLLLLTGCGSGGESPAAPSKPRPTPAPTVDDVADDLTDATEWGKLSCQKRGICENLILNVDFDALVYSLKTEFNNDFDNEAGDLSTTFKCGVTFFNFWKDWFPSHPLRTVDAELDLMELAFMVVNPKTCRLKVNVEQNLNNYFKNTKEYENENF